MRRGRWRWPLRAVLAIAAVVLVGLILFAGMLWWPAPGGPQVRCTRVDGPQCRTFNGRVLYALSKDRADLRRPLHLVLASRQSLTGPGITVVKVPSAMRPRDNPRVGAWVAFVGIPHRGSNGETDVTAIRLARASSGISAGATKRYYSAQ